MTPQRTGLRERRRPESPQHKGPTVTEVWVPEEDLELWEIRQFGEKIEKQQLAVREKLAQVHAQQSADKIRAQMEAQLKQQRLAMQQKRLQEGGAGATGVTKVGAPGTKTITVTVSTPQQAAAQGLTKVALVSSSGSPIKGTTLTSLVSTPGNTGAVGRAVRRIFTARPAGAANTGADGLAKLPIAANASPTLMPKGAAGTQQIVVRAPVAGQARPAVIAVRGVVPAAAGGGGTNAVIRPALGGNPTGTAAPVRAQIQIIQGPNGQLQVRGLMPGQQLIRLPDGRLQLLTLPVQAAPAVATSTAAGTVNATQPQTIQITTLRPAISLAPAVATAATPATVAAATAPTVVAAPAPQAAVSVAPAGTVQIVSQPSQIKVQQPTVVLSTALPVSSSAGAVVTTTQAALAPKLIQIRPQLTTTVPQQLLQTQVKVLPAVRPLVQATTAGVVPGTTAVRLQAATVSIPGLTAVVANPTPATAGTASAAATKAVLTPASAAKGGHSFPLSFFRAPREKSS